MWFQAIHEPTQDEEQCPTCRGAVRRRPHGEMHAGSFVLDGRRVEIRGVVAEGFADPIVLDATTQYFDGGLYRIWPSERYFSRGGKKLHRDVWQGAFGPIPEGCHIHHRDGEVGNNALANLECLPASEHLRRAWHKSKAGLASWQHFTETARRKAAEWHGSEAGRQWHRRHAERSKGWTKWKREPRDCPECGTRFNALVRKSGNAQIFCGETCKVAAYRKRQKALRAERCLVSNGS